MRIHNLRHSFTSALASTGTPLNVIGKALAHRPLSMDAPMTWPQDRFLLFGGADRGIIVLWQQP
jgi:integrase